MNTHVAYVDGLLRAGGVASSATMPPHDAFHKVGAFLELTTNHVMEYTS